MPAGLCVVACPGDGEEERREGVAGSVMLGFILNCHRTIGYKAIVFSYSKCALFNKNMVITRKLNLRHSGFNNFTK